ncbi:hypothetical protein Cgig2_010523 [Carnegiea gigantea]|uniref:IREH1/IRE-like N-terminal domain-containing protein n=1 Tax=Carnegiea gigantea TaxID=171969 RepID=A0A9Q1QP57_9CARY|nr:hypothetical protein Cgig2_010523 [Carnegiea gigantea]
MTTATAAVASSTTEPSAASKSMCALENASSGQSQTGESTGNDEEVVPTDSENANGVVNLNYSAEISGQNPSSFLKVVNCECDTVFEHEVITDRVMWIVIKEGLGANAEQRKKRQLEAIKIIPNNSSQEYGLGESPRFQEILRVTNGRTKKTPYTKSCSLNPGYKAVHSQLEDVKLMIREKFNQAKEEVNVELAVFAGELMAALRQTCKFHPEWKDLEDLLLVAHQSAKMSAEEFWSRCEGIVLNLDHHRRELPLGMVKQAHTRLLFILTYCTRLLQCQ